MIDDTSNLSDTTIKWIKGLQMQAITSGTVVIPAGMCPVRILSTVYLWKFMLCGHAKSSQHHPFLYKEINDGFKLGRLRRLFQKIKPKHKQNKEST